MTNTFPYSYVRCPCVDEPSLEGTLQRISQVVEQDDEQNKTFDPKGPRANYSLYPLEHLMWCEDCHEIRCPRCTIEEVVCWYCPTCLFEVASGMVRNEGTRCTRNCHNCPICTAPLAINSLDKEAGGLAGPWILACEYCSWTTLDVGIKFEKPNNIFGQLARIYTGKSSTGSSSTVGPQSSRAAALDEDDAALADPSPIKDHDARFRALRSFYATQLSKTGGPTNPLLSPGAMGSGDVNYNSPSTLARIMAMYTTSGNYGRKGTKPAAIRPAIKPEEGVLELSISADAQQVVRLLRTGGVDGTADMEQRRNQTHPPPTRFLEDLRPVPVQLRTKRSRRCRACRHILVRPETKVSSTRYRIKLVATSYVPAMTLAPLPASAGTAAQGSHATTMGLTAPTPLSLPPSRPLQFTLTLRNPMFDAIRVTLATPAVVPGATGSRVTILCPTFEVGAHTDAWDDALGDRRRSVLLGSGSAGGGERVAEAGKVWDRGRNWTSVVVEIVCGRLLRDAPRRIEDEDVLEIPVHVRLEYEAEVGGEEGGAGAGAGVPGKEEKREKRELTYWCVLGVGRIERVEA